LKHKLAKSIKLKHKSAASSQNKFQVKIPIRNR